MELFYLFIFADNPVFVFFVCGFSVYSFTMVLSGKLIKFRSTVPKSDISSSAILPWTEESQDQGHSKTNLLPDLSAFSLLKVEILHWFHFCHQFVDFNNIVSEMSPCAFPEYP